MGGRQAFRVPFHYAAGPAMLPSDTRPRVAIVGDADPTLISSLQQRFAREGVLAIPLTLSKLRVAARQPDLSLLVGDAAVDGGVTVQEALREQGGRFAVVMGDAPLAVRVEARQRGIEVIPRLAEDRVVRDVLRVLARGVGGPTTPMLEVVTDGVAPDSALLSELFTRAADRIAEAAAAAPDQPLELREELLPEAERLVERMADDLAALYSAPAGADIADLDWDDDSKTKRRPSLSAVDREMKPQSPSRPPSHYPGERQVPSRRSTRPGMPRPSFPAPPSLDPVSAGLEVSPASDEVTSQGPSSRLVPVTVDPCEAETRVAQNPFEEVTRVGPPIATSELDSDPSVPVDDLDGGDEGATSRYRALAEAKADAVIELDEPEIVAEPSSAGPLEPSASAPEEPTKGDSRRPSAVAPAADPAGDSEEEPVRARPPEAPAVAVHTTALPPSSSSPDSESSGSLRLPWIVGAGILASAAVTAAYIVLAPPGDRDEAVGDESLSASLTVDTSAASPDPAEIVPAPRQPPRPVVSAEPDAPPLEVEASPVDPDPDPDPAELPEGATAESLVRDGRAHERAARAADARASFEAALRLDEREPEAHAGLARVALATGDVEVAITHAERAAILRSRRARYHVLVGDARRAGGDSGGARRAYRRAIEVDPDNADARRRLGE